MSRSLLGAYDPLVWTGLVFSDTPGRGFALRFLVERDGERVDREDFHDLVKELGPHAPDGSYARIAFDTRLPFGKGKQTPLVQPCGEPSELELEWSRIDARSVVVRAHLGFEGSLELRGYFPWDWSGSWFIDEGRLLGVTKDAAAALAVVVASDVVMSSGITEEEAVLCIPARSGLSIDVIAVLANRPDEAKERATYVSREIDVDLHLARACEDYEAKRSVVEGRWKGAASAVTNSLHWAVALQPERGRLYTPAGRRWIFPAHGGRREHWTLFCWDSFFNALELAVENPAVAASTLEAVLESQYPGGNIPNWRGRFAGTPDRSQPPIGSFAVLKIFLRTGDRSLLDSAFPYLDRWSCWWRADKRGRPRRGGHHDGLYTWGSDIESVIHSPAPWENQASHRQKAAWESGQDDLPNWDEAGWNDETETFDLDAVDLNSYLALDFECLARIASELGKEERADTYRSLCDRLRKRVNEVLWDEERGMYVDRFRDGRFSKRLAASNFLPLLAGIPSRERAEKLLRKLRDTSLFWGRYAVPTISRDDSAFDDQQYWRGAIWPPINYLLSLGLRRYGFDEAASELAARSVNLVLAAWKQSSSCWENYDCRTGRGGGQRHQSWGPLMALMGIEEFIDVSPWDGLRIGSLHPKAVGALKHLSVAGHEWTISLLRRGMKVWRDGRELLDSSGSLVLRQTMLGHGSLTAEAHCREPVRLRLSLDGTCRDRLNIELEGEFFRSVSNVVVVPEGKHVLRVKSIA